MAVDGEDLEGVQAKKSAKEEAEQKAIQEVLLKARADAEKEAEAEAEKRRLRKLEIERKKKEEADLKVPPWTMPVYLRDVGEMFAKAQARPMQLVSELQMAIALEATLPILPRVFLRSNPVDAFPEDVSVREVCIKNGTELVVDVIPAVLTTSQDCTVKIWNAENGECETTLAGHTDTVSTASWSPNGKLVVTASEDCTSKAFNSRTGKCERTFFGHTDAVYATAFASDSKMVVTGSGDGTARVWSVKMDDCLRVLKGHTAAIYSVAFAEEDETVVTISRDTHTKMWNRRTGTCDRTLLFGSMEPQYCVSYSLDGASFASVPGDRTCKIMCTKTGTTVRILEGHAKLVLHAAYSPDVNADAAYQAFKREAAKRADQLENGNEEDE